MSFVRRLLSYLSPGRSVNKEFKVAELASQSLLQLLEAPVKFYSFDFKAIPLRSEVHAMLGFLAAASDVFAQSFGGSPAGLGSINATLRVYQALFDEQHTEALMESTFELSRSPTKGFEDGHTMGQALVNGFLRQDTDIPARIFVHLFSERYQQYCGTPDGLDLSMHSA